MKAKNIKIILCLISIMLITACGKKENEKINVTPDKSLQTSKPKVFDFIEKVTNYESDYTTEVLVDSAPIDKNEIASFYKHGDHWHVFTKDGKEFITYTDPSKLGRDAKALSKLMEHSATKVENVKSLGKKIISFYKHDDHWHVFTEDGKEYITYSDPSNLSKASTVDQLSDIRETEHYTYKDIINHTKKIYMKGKYLVIKWWHVDHWHDDIASDHKDINIIQAPKDYKIDSSKEIPSEVKFTRYFNAGDKIYYIKEQAKEYKNIGPFDKAIDLIDLFEVTIGENKFSISRKEYEMAVKTNFYSPLQTSNIHLYAEAGQGKIVDNNIIANLEDGLELTAYYTKAAPNGAQISIEGAENATFNWYYVSKNSTEYKLISKESDSLLPSAFPLALDYDGGLLKVVVINEGKEISQTNFNLKISATKPKPGELTEETLNKIANAEEIYLDDAGAMRIKWLHVNHYHYETLEWFPGLVFEEAPKDYVINPKNEIVSKIKYMRYFKGKDKIYYISSKPTEEPIVKPEVNKYKVQILQENGTGSVTSKELSPDMLVPENTDVYLNITPPIGKAIDKVERVIGLSFNMPLTLEAKGYKLPIEKAGATIKITYKDAPYIDNGEKKHKVIFEEVNGKGIIFSEKINANFEATENTEMIIRITPPNDKQLVSVVRVINNGSFLMPLLKSGDGYELYMGEEDLTVRITYSDGTGTSDGNTDTNNPVVIPIEDINDSSNDNKKTTLTIEEIGGKGNIKSDYSAPYTESPGWDMNFMVIPPKDMVIDTVNLIMKDGSEAPVSKMFETYTYHFTNTNGLIRITYKKASAVAPNEDDKPADEPIDTSGKTKLIIKHIGGEGVITSSYKAPYMEEPGWDMTFMVTPPKNKAVDKVELVTFDGKRTLMFSLFESYTYHFTDKDGLIEITYKPTDSSNNTASSTEEGTEDTSDNNTSTVTEDTPSNEKLYSLSFKHIEGNGTITSNQLKDSSKIAAETEVQFTVTPEAGKKITSVKQAITPTFSIELQSNNGTYNLYMPERDTEIIITYK